MFIINYVFVLKDYYIMCFNFVFLNLSLILDDVMLDDIV